MMVMGFANDSGQGFEFAWPVILLLLDELGGFSAGLLLGNLGAFLSGFRKTNRNCLLAAGDHAAFSALAGMKRTAFFLMKSSLYAFASRLAIFSHFFLAYISIVERRVSGSDP